MLRTACLAIALLCACGPAAQPSSTTTAQPTIDKNRAVAIATETGRAAGYDPALYDLKSADRDRIELDGGAFKGVWRVWFELKGRGRPGGHFTVYVAGDGTPRLIHGK